MLKVGDTVIVPGPDPGDAWSQGGFLARVSGFRGDGDAVVVDQEDNAWQVDCWRLMLYTENGEAADAAVGSGETGVGSIVSYMGVDWRVVGTIEAEDGKMVALEPRRGAVWVREDELTAASSDSPS